jgi:hypothetical protein
MDSIEKIATSESTERATMTDQIKIERQDQVVGEAITGQSAKSPSLA